jgi:serine/threonine protein kinase
MLKTACGSPCYAAPEMVAGRAYLGSCVDIWSSGVTLYAMVCGYLPFEEGDVALLYRKILKGEFEIPSFLSIQVVELLKGLLNVDPEIRLTFEQIHRHPWYIQGAPLSLS